MQHGFTGEIADASGASDFTNRFKLTELVVRKPDAKHFAPPVKD
jgi:hypothetical protein